MTDRRPSRAYGATARPLTAVALLSISWAALGASKPLADLSLEELSSIQVTSVSRRAERVGDAADSIFVITSEDIRRSGASTLVEALRLAPNLVVAQVDARQYAVSARGFNATTSNKLLVLIDGRSVYTPLFSGVFWDAQDVLLEDIERIEVVSGPGGTLWGTNAVNGVISVITRSARESQGAFGVARSGNQSRSVGARYGGRFGDTGHYRLSAKAYGNEQTRTTTGSTRQDAMHRQQAGFRADMALGGDQVTVQGDFYEGSFQQPGAPRGSFSGVNLLSRWDRPLGGDSALQIQGYYERTERDHAGSFGETLDIVDLQAQHSLRPHPRHQVVWGGGWRYAVDDVANTPVLAFLPPHVEQKWATVFAQDDIELRNDLRLTVGSRLERNDYTGTEVLPSARLAWRLDTERLIWAQLARAVRAPSRIDRDLFAPGQPPYVLAGGPTFRSEILKSTELGFRSQPSPRLTYTATAFHHIYDHLRSVETRAGVQTLENNMEGSVTGIETWGTWHLSSRWRMTGGWTLMHQRIRLRADSSATGTASEGNDPAHHWQIRSAHDLPRNVELDVALRRVGALPNPAVPARTALDVRVGWLMRRDVELSIIATSLNDRSQPEFGALPGRSEIGRSVMARVIWKP